MDATWWLDLGIAGAVVFVVQMFLRHLRQERSDRRSEREAFLTLIANHIDHERETLEDLARAIRGLEVLLRECVKPAQTSHDGR